MATITFNDSFRSENATNGSNSELPIDMTFNDGHLLSAIVYGVLMVISAVGNLSVLNSIVKIKLRSRLNRVNLLLMHLVIADLFVTFLMMPMEIGWNLTVTWEGGDFMCRLMSFFRIFGLYLSGFIVVCISFDRYFAVLKPLTLPDADKRSRVMLYSAWIGSAIFSLPQAYVFRLENHPTFTWYEQCTTLNTFSSKAVELTYNFFGFILLYAVPMVVILFCYLSILKEMYKVNSLRKQGEDLRRSSSEALSRAKVRTLKMTVVIVVTFFFCWTPYNVMSLWYWIDRDSAMQVDQRVQKGLFLFAVSSSCVNPLIYGFFHLCNPGDRGKQEERVREVFFNNNCLLERMDRPPYGIRIRWKPRECLFPATSSSSARGNQLAMRPKSSTSDVQRCPPIVIRMNNDTVRDPAREFQSRNNHHGAPKPSKATSNLIPLTSKEIIKRHIPSAQIIEIKPLEVAMDPGVTSPVICNHPVSSSTPRRNVGILANLELDNSSGENVLPEAGLEDGLHSNEFNASDDDRSHSHLYSSGDEGSFFHSCVMQTQSEVHTSV